MMIMMMMVLLMIMIMMLVVNMMMMMMLMMMMMMMTMLMMMMMTMMMTMRGWRVASVTTSESGRVTRSPLTHHAHCTANTMWKCGNSNTIALQIQIHLDDA